MSGDGNKDRNFLGTGWRFPPAFDPRTLATVMVSAEEDIDQSLHILFSTAPGERVMHPTFGCGLKHMVFEHINESTVTEIRDIVRRAVLFFEPRITLDHIEVDSAELHDGVLRLRLDYTVRTTNARSNKVLELSMNDDAVGQARLPA